MTLTAALTEAAAHLSWGLHLQARIREHMRLIGELQVAEATEPRTRLMYPAGVGPVMDEHLEKIRVLGRLRDDCVTNANRAVMGALT